MKPFSGQCVVTIPGASHPSQAEEAALSADSSEPVLTTEAEEDLSGEAGEELPEDMQDTLPEATAKAEVQAGEAPQAEQLDPVQSQEQMGRLPQELILEAAADSSTVASEEADPVVEVQAAADNSVALEQIPAEPVTAAVEILSSEAPDATSAAEADIPVTVQDVLETFTESLIVTGTTTETSDLSVGMGEPKIEVSAVLEEAIVVALEPATVLAEAQEATAGSAGPAEAAGAPAIEAAAEVSPQAISETPGTAEAAADTNPEVTVTEEAAQGSPSPSLEAPEAAPQMTVGVSDVTEVSQEPAKEAQAEQPATTAIRSDRIRERRDMIRPSFARAGGPRDPHRHHAEAAGEPDLLSPGSAPAEDPGERPHPGAGRPGRCRTSPRSRRSDAAARSRRRGSSTW